MGRVYETAIKIGAAISKSFRGDTHGAAAALGKLTASQKKLDAAISSSKTRYNYASEALQRLKDAQLAAGGATKESTKWIKAGEKEVAGLAKELDRATEAAKKNAEAIRELPKHQFEHAREHLFGKKKEHEPLIAEAKEQFKSVGESILHLVEVGAVAGETLHLLAERTIKAGADIGETSEKLGIGTRALQELRYGAQQSGAQVEDLDKALAKMAVNIGKSKAAKGKAGGLLLGGVQMSDLKGVADAAGKLDPFKRIGLSAKQLSTLKPEEQLKKIADGMLKLKTHADKATVAQAIFGKGATQLLPYLSEGAEGIEKLSNKANQYGGVLSEESIEAAVVAEKASKDMSLALSGVTNTIGAALLPVMTKAFKGISKWALDNRAQIKKWAETAAKWIEEKAVPAFFKLVDGIESVAAKALNLVEGAAKLAGGFGNLAIAVGLVRLAPLASTLVKIGIEGFRAADALFKMGEASKAANAMNALGGADHISGLGKALGAAATAQMVLGAAAIGYAIGTALDNWIGASDWFGKLARIDEDKNDKAYDSYTKKAKLNLKHNLSAPTAAPLADLGLDTGAKPIGLVGADKLLPRAAVTAPIQVIYGSTPAELLNMLEDAQRKQKDALAKELQRHHAQKRRVSLAH